MINGVSDDFVSQSNLLSRADDDLHNELTAALEVGYLLRLSHAPGRQHNRPCMFHVPVFSSPLNPRQTAKIF